MLLKPRCFVLHTFIYAKPTNVRVFLRLGEPRESLLTAVSDAEAVGEPVDVSIVSPGRHVNEEVG